MKIVVIPTVNTRARVRTKRQGGQPTNGDNHTRAALLCTYNKHVADEDGWPCVYIIIMRMCERRGAGRSNTVW